MLEANYWRCSECKKTILSDPSATTESDLQKTLPRGWVRVAIARDGDKATKHQAWCRDCYEARAIG